MSKNKNTNPKIAGLLNKNIDPRNYYQVLGVDSNATPEIIKREYTALDKLITNELNTNLTPRTPERNRLYELQDMVGNAYNVLKDPNKRAAYDLVTKFHSTFAEPENQFKKLLNADLNSLNHYQLLGVSKDADTKLIKQAFEDISKAAEAYNTSNPELAQKNLDLMGKARTAYNIIKDPDKRHIYDQVLDNKIDLSFAQKLDYTKLNIDTLKEKTHELLELKLQAMQGKNNSNQIQHLSAEVVNLQEKIKDKGYIEPLSDKELKAIDQIAKNPKVFARIIDTMGNSNKDAAKANKQSISVDGFLLSTSPDKWDGLLKLYNASQKREQTKGGLKSKLADFVNKIDNTMKNLVGKGIKNKDIETVYNALEKSSKAKIVDIEKGKDVAPKTKSFVEKLKAKSNANSKPHQR